MKKKGIMRYILIGMAVGFMAVAPAAEAQRAGDGALGVQQLRGLAAAGRWLVYTNNPVLRPGSKGEWDAGALGSMTVLKVGEAFHMYYEAWGVRRNSATDYNSIQIGHATSRDGLHWTKDPANPVLPKGTANAWDRDGTWDPFVLHEDGGFKMWYGGGMDQHCDWGYAVSTDGVHFVKKGQISRLGNVEDDHVVHDKATGRYFMYYWDRAHEPMGLFRAPSQNETDFDFAHAEPIRIEGLKYPAMYKFTHVFQDGGLWHMFFGEFVRPGCKGCRTGYATSPDGLHWTARNPNHLVGQDGEVLKVADDVWLMLYGPDGYFDQARCDIRLAVYKGGLKSLKSTPDLTGSEDRAATAMPPGGCHLGTRRNDETGKASFLLNGQPFYPFVYYENYRAVTPKLLAQLRSEGFNSIQIAIDARDAGSEDLRQVLQLLHRRGIPTFVEINEGEFWKALRADLSLNMVTADGKPLQHFPDYANPETRRQHLERFARAAKLLQPYAHQPVIGICVGAYDAYHLPDGEKHPLFEAPQLVRKYQTLLPFGEHARTRFLQRLRETGVSPQSLGLERWEGMARPPSTPEEASNPRLWQEWIHFRRHLVREWLKDTLEVVKAGAGLPVTVTFDINFSLREQYATPPAGWVDLLDFVILYYYGQGDPDRFIPSLLREVYRGFSDAGKPMICLHEFSSAYGITSGEAYARTSAPFVSGMMTTGPRWTSLVPGARPHNQERVQSFTGWVREHLVGLADAVPPRSPLLILLDRDLAYVENPFSATLAPLGIAYDVRYVTAKTARIPANGYSHVLIPATFASDLRRKIPSGRKVIVENSRWLQELPSPGIPQATPDQWQTIETKKTE